MTVFVVFVNWSNGCEMDVEKREGRVESRVEKDRD